MSSPEPWPPTSGLTTKIVSRKDTILPISASLRIPAPAAVVWSVLLDTSTYPLWNTFCPRVTIHSQPEGVDPKDPTLHLSTSFTFHIVMDKSKPTKVTDTQLRVTDFSTPQNPSDYIPMAVLKSEPSFSSDLGHVYRIAWTTEGGFVARGLKTERFHEIIPILDGQGGVECEVRTWECQGGPLARAVKYMFKETLQKKFMEWCEDLKKEAEKRLTEGLDTQQSCG